MIKWGVWLPWNYSRQIQQSFTWMIIRSSLSEKWDLEYSEKKGWIVELKREFLLSWAIKKLFSTSSMVAYMYVFVRKCFCCRYMIRCRSPGGWSRWEAVLMVEVTTTIPIQFWEGVIGLFLLTYMFQVSKLIKPWLFWQGSCTIFKKSCSSSGVQEFSL